MRGGPPRGSMKLDNRPKKLLVKGVTGDQVQSVRDWYEVSILVLVGVGLRVLTHLFPDHRAG